MTDPLVVLRTGGSPQIGFGHVRRCLSLAEALRRQRATSLFILHGDAALIGQVAAAGFESVLAETPDCPEETVAICRQRGASAVVADSYSFGGTFLGGLARAQLTTLLIDDLGDRQTPVDIVVNGAAGAERIAYTGAPHTAYLLGPRYVLLREAFAASPRRTYAERARRVLITLGGTNPLGLTALLIDWVGAGLSDVKLDVVIGPLANDAERIDQAARRWPHRVLLHRSPPDMRSLMLEADIAICAGGQTTYELAATGTPSIAIQVAENQRASLRSLEEAGTLTVVGAAGEPELRGRVNYALAELAASASQRAAMGDRGRALVDGLGAKRVAQRMLEEAQKREHVQN